MGDAVRIVGERDNVIQLQQNNQHGLLDLLDSMVHHLHLPAASVRLLSDCDLSGPAKVDACAHAACQLLDVLEAEVAPGLKRLRAYEEQVFESLLFYLDFVSTHHMFFYGSNNKNVRLNLDS